MYLFDKSIAADLKRFTFKSIDYSKIVNKENCDENQFLYKIKHAKKKKRLQRKKKIPQRI